MLPESHIFPYTFDIQRLKADLATCRTIEWKKHFHTEDYTGMWTSLSLRSISGKESDILSTPNASYQDTPMLAKCPYFQEILDFFQCPKDAVRLLSLFPHSYIKEHKDASAGYEDGFFRIHIPIQTNDSVIFTVNGKNLQMKVGECWYANFNLPHYVANESEEERVHLVIDCLRNAWSDEVFAQAGYDFEAEREKIYDKETKLKMIKELSYLDNEAAKQLIAQLQAEIDAS